MINQVNSLVKKWQDILRLNHWAIRAVIGDIDKMDGRSAMIYFDTEYNMATIQVAEVTENDIPEQWKGYYSLEQTIIHELLHLVLANMEKLWENAIEDLAPSTRKLAEKQWNVVSEQPTELLANVLYNLKGGEQDRKV